MDDAVDTPLGVSLSQKIFAYHWNRRGNEGLGSDRHDGIRGLDLERRYGLGACSSGELGEDGTHGLAPWRTRGLRMVAVFQDTPVAGRFGAGERADGGAIPYIYVAAATALAVVAAISATLFDEQPGFATTSEDAVTSPRPKARPP